MTLKRNHSYATLGLTATLLISAASHASTPASSPAKPAKAPAAASASATPATPAATSTDPVLIRGKSIELRRSDFEMEKKNLPPDQRVQLSTNMERVQRTLERMAVNRALLEELRNAGFDKDPSIQAELTYIQNQKLVQMWVAKFQAELKLPDFEPAIREKYRLNADKLAEPEKVRASHVLITAKGRSKEEARKLAEEVRAKALAGEKFDELAKQYSEDPSARRNSGDLGFFPAAQMVPQFSKAAFELKKEGDISPVVETDFGFHVIRFTDRLAARTPSIDEVRTTYLEELTRDYQNQALRKKLDEIIAAQQPQANMDEVNQLLDQGSMKAAKEFNDRIRKEIEESQRKNPK